jgi:hypothetical protein
MAQALSRPDGNTARVRTARSREKGLLRLNRAPRSLDHGAVAKAGGRRRARTRPPREELAASGGADGEHDDHGCKVIIAASVR